MARNATDELRAAQEGMSDLLHLTAQYENYLQLSRITEVPTGPVDDGLPEFFAPAPAPLTLTINSR